ncbi:hypothetical protein J1605_012963 [Eschrichtius robustus]|uniref:Uncharacterized protein n=1 Tax=Eschrichtius robustus TaxID=9764 RepID=A0AB34GIL8_ESCRO|nr:hypothetical protein J1605_012963 [Eschrichtius robustus]
MTAAGVRRGTRGQPVSWARAVGLGKAEAGAHPTVPRALVAGLGRWPDSVPSSQEPGLLAQQASEPLSWDGGAPVTASPWPPPPSSSEPTQDPPVSPADRPAGAASMEQPGPSLCLPLSAAPSCQEPPAGGETNTDPPKAGVGKPCQLSPGLLGAHLARERGGCASRGVQNPPGPTCCSLPGSRPDLTPREGPIPRLSSPPGQRSASLDVPGHPQVGSELPTSLEGNVTPPAAHRPLSAQPRRAGSLLVSTALDFCPGPADLRPPGCTLRWPALSLPQVDGPVAFFPAESTCTNIDSEMLIGQDTGSMETSAPRPARWALRTPPRAGGQLAPARLPAVPQGGQTPDPGISRVPQPTLSGLTPNSPSLHSIASPAGLRISPPPPPLYPPTWSPGHSPPAPASQGWDKAPPHPGRKEKTQPRVRRQGICIPHLHLGNEGCGPPQVSAPGAWFSICKMGGRGSNGPHPPWNGEGQNGMRHDRKREQAGCRGPSTGGRRRDQAPALLHPPGVRRSCTQPSLSSPGQEVLLMPRASCPHRPTPPRPAFLGHPLQLPEQRPLAATALGVPSPTAHSARFLTEAPAPPQDLRLERRPSPKARELPGLNWLSQAPPARPLSPSAPGVCSEGPALPGDILSDGGAQLLPSPDLGAPEDTGPGAPMRASRTSQAYSSETPPAQCSSPRHLCPPLPPTPRGAPRPTQDLVSVPEPRAQGTLKGPSRHTVAKAGRGNKLLFRKGKPSLQSHLSHFTLASFYSRGNRGLEDQGVHGETLSPAQARSTKQTCRVPPASLAHFLPVDTEPQGPQSRGS